MRHQANKRYNLLKHSHSYLQNNHHGGNIEILQKIYHKSYLGFKWSLCFNCVFVTFPCGILGQERYLIVSIPDRCNLSYFGMVGDIRDQLKFRYHGNIAAILKCFKQHFILNNTFWLSQTLVGGYGEHGVLELTFWLCSGILYGSRFQILQISSKKHVVFNSAFVEGICAKWMWNFAQEYMATMVAILKFLK